MEVADVPGHQVRLAETQSKYGDDAPVYDGVKVREIRGVLVSDYVAGNGRGVLVREVVVNSRTQYRKKRENRV